MTVLLADAGGGREVISRATPARKGSKRSVNIGWLDNEEACCLYPYRTVIRQRRPLYRPDTQFRRDDADAYLSPACSGSEARSRRKNPRYSMAALPFATVSGLGTGNLIALRHGRQHAAARAVRCHSGHRAEPQISIWDVTRSSRFSADRLAEVQRGSASAPYPGSVAVG